MYLACNVKLNPPETEAHGGGQLDVVHPCSVPAETPQEMVECFHNGGRSPRPAHHRCPRVRADESGEAVAAALTERLLSFVPGLQRALKRGIDVLDIGCSSGAGLNLLAARYPRSRFWGYDSERWAIDTARNLAAQQGLANITFRVESPATLKDVQAFDLITAFDVLGPHVAPDKALSGICRALRHDGTFLARDGDGSGRLQENFQRPIGSFLYTVSTLHCMNMGVLLSEEKVAEATCRDQRLARHRMIEAGFGCIETHRLPHDSVHCYYVATKRV